MKDPTEDLDEDPSKYPSPIHVSNSLLVVTDNGVIARIYCPFKITCILTNMDHQIGNVLLVKAVMFTPVLMYKIDSRNYPYYHYYILKQ